jgi:hypothetical protein
MSALKFFTEDVSTGFKKLISALTATTGASDANKIIATDSSGKLDASFLPAGVELAVETIVTSEALTAGDFVNIYDNAGTRTARKADAATAKPAHGFVLAGVTSGQNASVYIAGINNQVTGYTAGGRIFLSATTPGQGTASVPAQTSGYIHQVLGVAISATSIRFEFDDPILIA